MGEKAFWSKLIKKAFIVAGLSYFGVAASTLQFASPVPAFIAGGVYMFAEAARYYKVSADNATLKEKHKKTKEFLFLI